THRFNGYASGCSTGDDQMTTQMAKLFAAAGQAMPEVKYTFELNPEHGLVQKVAEIADEQQFCRLD
ncbi:heat shock protein 90, partial [Pasteurella multocida subsp. multocida str. Anand1_cattle]